MRKDVVNARRSKTRFDEKVDEARKLQKAAKTESDKIEIGKYLQKTISKRKAAAIKLENLKKAKEDAKNNGIIQTPEQ